MSTSHVNGSTGAGPTRARRKTTKRTGGAPARATEELKAERVQEKLKAERIQGKLKAERVQQKLARVPGWVLDANGLMVVRVREFPNERVAAAFAGYATLLGRGAERPVGVAVAGRVVVLALPLQSQRGACADLTKNDLNLAEALSLRN
jgi:pterin-4a-carbinolamine dehydratase